jgi:hypothetical protein
MVNIGIHLSLPWGIPILMTGAVKYKQMWLMAPGNAIAAVGQVAAKSLVLAPQQSIL